MADSHRTVLSLSFAQAPSPSPVGKYMNTKMKSNNNREAKTYGMTPAPNKALELVGSAAA